MNFRHRIDNEFGGIVPYHEVFYILAIRDAALKSLEHFRRFLHTDLDEPTPRAACSESYSAIVQAANVSKYFWPNDGYAEGQKRAEKLRIAFAACDLDALRERTLRHRIEHFDERLDKFLASDPAGEIIDGFIGSVERCREPHQKVVRMVDPEAQVSIIFGREFPYGRVFDALPAIALTAQRMDEIGGRLSP